MGLVGGGGAQPPRWFFHMETFPSVRAIFPQNQLVASPFFGESWPDMTPVFPLARSCCFAAGGLGGRSTPKRC